MTSFLSDIEYKEIYQTLAATERGQAFLNTFAVKNKSETSDSSSNANNALSSLAYAVAQEFSDLPDVISDAPVEASAPPIDDAAPMDLDSMTVEPSESIEIGAPAAVAETIDLEEIQIAPASETAQEDVLGGSDLAAFEADEVAEDTDYLASPIDTEQNIVDLNMFKEPNPLDEFEPEPTDGIEIEHLLVDTDDIEIDFESEEPAHISDADDGKQLTPDAIDSEDLLAEGDAEVLEAVDVTVEAESMPEILDMEPELEISEDEIAMNRDLAQEVSDLNTRLTDLELKIASL